MAVTPSRQLLTGAQVFDGRSHLGPAEVAVEGTLIAAVGPPGTLDRNDASVVDLAGLLLAPGFTDLHGMDASPAGFAGKDGANLLLQGVTTIVIGHCGTGLPWSPESVEVPVNVVRLIGHNALSHLAAEQFEPGSPQALSWMEATLQEELDHGALGLSLGLMYEPGRSAPQAQIKALAELVGRAGGMIAAHVRDEGSGFLRSLREIVDLPGTADRMVMHLKACGRQNWNQLEDGRQLLEEAGVRWTYYPYTDTNTRLVAVFPDGLAQLSAEARVQRLADPKQQALVDQDGLQSLAARRWDGVTITAGRSEWLGRSIANVAFEAGEAPALTAARLVLEDPGARVRFHDVAELAGLRRSAEHPHALHGSDAYVFNSDDVAEHPRNFGAVARSVCWRRDAGQLEQGIEMLTGRAADAIGLVGRGRIAPGAVADLIGFDVDGLADLATYERPYRLSTGVEHVWVAGMRAVADGAVTGASCGAVLDRVAGGIR